MASDPGGAAAAVQSLDQRWRRLARQRRLYSVIIVVGLAAALAGALDYANDANAGSFLDRLPHFFDFLSWLVPDDWNDVWRALLSLPTPHDNGTEATDYASGRIDLFAGLFVPNYFNLMFVTLNVAIVSTIVGVIGGTALAFLAARNTMANGLVRGLARRVAEFFRAFPEIVIAGLVAAILSIGPIAALFAVSVHTVGSLGKLFYEVIENADMKAEEGLKAVGATWAERMRYGILPHVLPNLSSYALLRLEINVRASTIIGAVGGGGIGQELKLAISRGFGPKTIALVLMLFVTIVAVDQLSAHLRKRFVGEQAFAPPL